MNVLNIVRRRIQLLYEKHPNIHVNFTLKRPHKVIVNNLPVVITGVYDDTYQMCLLAFLELDNLDRKARVNQLKAKL